MNTTSTTDGQPTVTWVLEAKFKELTDEEMYELLEKYQGIELCKAVLRKAQER